MTDQKVKTITNDLKQLRNKKKMLSMEQNSLQSNIDKLQNQLNMEKAEIKVSDHALIRYLERKLSLDLNDIRSEIMSEKLLSYANMVGKTGKFTMGDMKIVMKNGVIVTLY